MKFEELKGVLEQTPELLKEITSSFKDKIVPELETAGYVVRSTDEDASYLENQIKAVLPGRIGTEFGNAMRNIDEQIKSITGIEKNNGEKTTDYAKRAVEERTSKGQDPISKQRLADLEKELENVKTTSAQQIEQANKKLFSREVDLQLSSSLANVNFAVPAHLTTEDQRKEFIELQRQSIKTLFGSSYRPERHEETGEIVFYEGEKPMLNTKDGKPMTATDLVNLKFSAYFSPLAPVKTGTGQGKTGSSAGAQTFATREDIHAHLKAAGVSVTSPEYMRQYKQLAEDNKL
jgi:hypothetical protein